MKITHETILRHLETCESCRASAVRLEMSRRGSRSLETMTPAARHDRAVNAAAARHDSQAAKVRREGLARLRARSEDQPATSLSPFDQRARDRDAAVRRAQESTDE